MLLTIRTLIYGLVSVVAMPLIAVVTYLIMAHHADERAEALDTTARLAGYSANEMEQVVSGSEAILAAVGARESVRALDPAACDRSLSILRDADPARANIAVIDRTGHMICSALPIPGGVLDVSDTEWFQRVMAENRFVVSRLREARIIRRLVVVLAYPVRDDAGAPIGVVILPHELAKLRPLPDFANQPEGTAISIVDREGIVIARQPQTDWVGRDFSTHPIVATALAGGAGAAVGTTADGTEVVFAYRPIAAAGWTAIATIPTTTVFAEARADTARSSAAVGLLLVVVLALVATLVRRIIGPIDQIAATSRAVAAGDLDARMSVQPQAEFAVVARQFNAMLEVRQRSEQTFHDLLENAPDGMLLVDSRGAIRFANSQIETMFGHARAELDGQPVELLIPERLRARHVTLRAGYERTPATRPMGRTLDLVARRKDGSDLEVAISLSPMATPNGAMTCCAVRDVTERRAAQRRIQKLNRMYLALSRTGQAITRVTDRQRLLDEVCRIAVEQGQLALAWIGLLDPSSRLVRPAACFGSAAPFIQDVRFSLDPADVTAHGPTARAIREGRLIILPEAGGEADPRVLPLRDRAHAHGIFSGAAFPLREEGVVVGAISFNSSDAGYFDDPDLVQLLTEMADDLSFALDGLRRDAALAEAEERVRQIAENSRDVFWLTEPSKGQVLYISPGYEEVWGRVTSELYASPRSWIEAIHPDDRERVSAAAHTRQVSGDYDEEYRIVRPDGEIRWIHDRAFPVRDAAGAVYRIAGIAEDVTQRKTAQDRIVESERRLESVLASTADAFFMLDRDDRFTYLNPQAEKLLRRPREELLGRVVWTEFPESLGTPFETHTRFAKESRETAHFEALYAPYQSWYQVDLYPDADGLSVFFRDTTEHKAAEETLKRSEASLAAAQSIAHLGSWDRDLATETATWSAEMYRLFAYDPTRPLPTFEEFIEWIHPDDRQAVRSGRESLLRTGESSTLEFRNDPTRGSARFFSASATPVKDAEGRLVKLTGTVLDVTRIKEAEAKLLQAQKMEALGSFAGGIAHDFNNMLMPIMALTQVVKANQPADSPNHESLDAVIEAARRATDLVKQILTFSRQDTSQRAPIDISRCAADALELLRNVLPSTVTLVRELAPEVGRVLGDAAQIQSVILNLGANAAHAMNGKVGRLTVGLSRTLVDEALAHRHMALATGGAYAKLTISDTGHGMDERTLKKIFDPFFTTKAVGEGTGLGLAMVHGIITGMGGAIEVSSTVGVGTTFDLYLPLNSRGDEGEGGMADSA